MANSAQARKRARQNTVSRLRNAGQRSMLRTYVKKVVKAIESGDKAQAQAEFKRAESVIDRIADKDIIHKNKAARTKSRLVARIKALGA
ncbi:MAG: 30S ribosomal protein S20 [Pseudomonadota bacterium]